MKSENEDDKEQELTATEAKDIAEQESDGEGVDEDLIEILSSPEARETILSAMYAGPVPPPAMLVEYEEALPGMANRIMEMAEKEQGIRSRDNKHLLLNDTFRVSGSVLVSLVLVGGAVYCGVIGEPWLGGALAASSAIPGIIKHFNKKPEE